MKSKILYVLLAVLTTVLLISFLTKKKPAKVEPAQEEEQTDILQSNLLQHEPDKTHSSVKNKRKSAITIIKPPVEENPLLSEEKIKEIKEPKKKQTAVRPTQAVSVQQPEAPPNEPASGITEEGIRKPTVEEQKEMNAQGIVMW